MVGNIGGRQGVADVWTIIKQWPELILERLEEEGVARITLNRPDKRNCWNREMCEAFLESLEIIRADRNIKCCITRGAGKVFSSGLDLKFLREVSNGPLLDWDRPTPTIQIANALRGFPRIMIAQIHGYCLGGAFGIMNCHDLVYGADDVQIGMPEILRGSFGQLVTSTLLHGGLPIKKLSHIALVGRNITGKEADALGIISQSVPASELEAFTLQVAREIGSRHLAPLEHHKITVQLGRDLGINQAIQVDQLVGSRLRHAMDPLGDVENYLSSQKGGPNLEYKRPDVE
jgi:trans-feruloyl-CoA hydratase/vanillin synthase